MFDILSIIPGKKKTTAGGWHSFNAICCSHRGHKSDRRMRGGIHFGDNNSWSYHCFNCDYRCHFEPGRSITNRVRDLLKWSGIDEVEIQRWNLESLQQKDFLDFTRKFKKEKPVNLKVTYLPEECEELDLSNPKHEVFVEYLNKRAINLDEHTFYVTPDAPGRYNNRVIVPYTFKGDIVGHTSRFLDTRIPKYINEQQPGYVFGYDFQKPEWQYCILVEGIFDALSINGCALTHNNISPEQARMLSQLNRQIIMVPDRDKPGFSICDEALHLGYSVSIPDWDKDIKDVNDAVIRYGRLPTLLSIIQSATTSKIKIEMQRKKIGKQNGF